MRRLRRSPWVPEGWSSPKAKDVGSEPGDNQKGCRHSHIVHEEKGEGVGCGRRAASRTRF